MGVAVSPEENLLFFIDDSGVYRGDLEGSSDKTFVAEIQDARFCAILSESAPTPDDVDDAVAPMPDDDVEPESAPTPPPDDVAPTPAEDVAPTPPPED